MIRFLAILIFLILYFLVGILAWVVLFIIGKFNLPLRHKISLKMVQGAFRIILKVAGTKVKSWKRKDSKRYSGIICGKS